MDTILDFISDNYFWIILIVVILLMALIGYIAEKQGFGKKAKKPEKVLENVNVPLEQIKSNDSVQQETNDLFAFNSNEIENEQPELTIAEEESSNEPVDIEENTLEEFEQPELNTTEEETINEPVIMEENTLEEVEQPELVVSEEPELTSNIEEISSEPINIEESKVNEIEDEQLESKDIENFNFEQPVIEQNEEKYLFDNEENEPIKPMENENDLFDTDEDLYAPIGNKPVKENNYSDIDKEFNDVLSDINKTDGKVNVDLPKIDTISSDDLDEEDIWKF